MPKGYKKEWVQKVKEKFNDIQPDKQINKQSSVITSNDKRSEAKHSARMVRV